MNLVKDIIIEHSKLRRLVGFAYLCNKLGCTEHEAQRAVTRALQLYPDLKGMKIFDAMLISVKKPAMKTIAIRNCLSSRSGELLGDFTTISSCCMLMKL